MLPNQYTFQSLRTAGPLYLALLLLVLSLFIFFAGEWALYSLFREAREDQLSRRVFDIARAYEPAIADHAESIMAAFAQDELPETDVDWMLWFDDLKLVFGDDLEELQTELKIIQDRHRLSSVVLMSLQQRMIVDASGETRPGRLAPLVAIDLLAWTSVAQGVPSDTPYYEFEGFPHKRVYIPILLPEEDPAHRRVGAVLRIEAGSLTFREMGHLQNQGFFLAAIVTALMGTVALLFHRLMRLFGHLQETAAHRDRLQAMGTLTAGIAHEIRNPLGIIRTLAEGIAGDLEPPHPCREMADDVVDEVERLNGLVKQYLAFARPDTAGVVEHASLDDVVFSLTNLFEKSDQDSNPIRVHIPKNLPPVRMNDPALKQILLNLILNARDASEPGSPITIRCQPRRNNSQVEIQVSDNGSGISGRDLKRVFDPFFTTRASGSGLGLAICRTLVTDRGGTIAIQSRLKQGTTIRIVLPVSEMRNRPS